MKKSFFRNLNKVLILAIVLFGIVGTYRRMTAVAPLPSDNEPPVSLTEVSPPVTPQPAQQVARQSPTAGEGLVEAVEVVPVVAAEVSLGAFPVKDGKITRTMDWYWSEFYRDWRYHGGIDIEPATESGPVTVYCCTSGMVQEVQEDEFMGVVVEVSSGEGLRWRYGGLSAAKVSKGEKVLRGNAIGTLTGAPAAEPGTPHLHLEVWKGGEQLDPARYIETR
ncbi:MAG TPA: M23 family metallopeptidase [Firmicutes bacterium]|nr:M23 family metallopeptidase [Bacillota bacterium]